MLWGGAVVSAALFALWVTSTVWYVGWRTSDDRLRVHVAYGSVGLARSTVLQKAEPVKTHWVAAQMSQPNFWWVSTGGDAFEWWVWVPLWMPLVVSLGVTAAAWRLEVLARRRARVGKCASCGYDRAGLKAGAVCPECGAESDRTERDEAAVAKQ